MSPIEVKRNIFVWNGKVMLVEGWLGNCNSLNCGIYSSLEDAKIVENNHLEDDSWKTEEWSAAMGRRLSIGASESFDFRAQFLAMRKVIVRGRVSDECSQRDNPKTVGPQQDPPQNKFCFDRATDLKPFQLYPSF